MTHEHPFRTTPINTFKALNGARPHYISFIGMHPVWFGGDTEKDSFQRADDFRVNAIEEHEAAYIARKEAAQKRKKK